MVANQILMVANQILAFGQTCVRQHTLGTSGAQFPTFFGWIKNWRKEGSVLARDILHAGEEGSGRFSTVPRSEGGLPKNRRWYPGPPE